MAIDIPVWAALPADVTDAFGPKFGPGAEKLWDGWDQDKRLRLLDVMAVLRRYELWRFIDTVTFGTLVRENRWGKKNDKVEFTIDTGGWWLAVMTLPGVEKALADAGFEDRFNMNHIENQTNYMEPGKGTVMHWGRLIAPYDKYTTLHFDSGGGRIWSREHFHEFWTGKGMTTEEVTADIGRTPAGIYLRGICPALDALLLQDEVDQIFGN
jgi:hypothetical protein